MRWALVLAFVLALSLPAFGGARGGADVRAIRALLHKQLTLVQQGKFRQLYALTTAALRRRCPYARFVRGAREVRRAIGPNSNVDRILVDFKANRRAVVQYRFLKNRKPFIRVRFSDGDLYTKLGTRWYDEYDAVTCS